MPGGNEKSLKKAKYVKDVLRSCFGKITLKVVWKVKVAWRLFMGLLQ